MNQDDRLGPYRLLRRLGEGGMGVVHLAVDPQGRQVAVKVLRGEVAGDDVARRRLSREVETMRRVRSEYIAEVLDADVTGHRPYIVTRYVPGQPLDEVVKQDGPLDLPALLKVAHGVASALASVHSVGVIHRDLKPGNVLILDGQPVLIDFGIAQAVDATRLTQTGMFIGTPGYLAPEIIEGHEAGPEVDVHAWAGTLVFAATGEPPFGKGTLEMIFYNITAGKANVSGAPQELQPILRAALQRDPAKRPSAAELAVQVARLMPPPGLGNRPRVPDEITTVPRFDDSRRGGTGTHGETPGRGGTAGHQSQASPGTAAPTGPGAPGVAAAAAAGTAGPVTGSLLPPDPGEVQTPVASRPGTAAPTPWPPAAAEQPREYVSLLDEQSADPWPTRRVTPEELRQAAAAQQASYDLPTGMLEPEDVPTGRVPGRETSARTGQSGQPGQSAQAPQPGRQGSETAGRQPATAPVGDGDIPTQRVRPHELPEYLRNHGGSQQAPAQPHAPSHGQGHPQQHGHQPVTPPPYPQHPPYEQAQRPHQPVTPPPYPYAHPQAPAHQQGPAHHVSSGQFHPGQRPGHALKRSRAYDVASIMLLVIMTVAAVVAPVIVTAVAIPVAILLRAADIAQPRLNGRRPVGAAAADVFRVFGQPGALLKSVGITVALVPYALILGLPVTLLLAVLVTGMPIENALAWGAAVALWTICAGPGVEGPGRQMRRTLASLLPSRNAAMATAAALGVVAALMVVPAVGTVGEDAREAIWAPVDVERVVTELKELRKQATR
ncbi:serine/threonine-protein kinase [Planobispora takensis]|uniref:serine/threonine-protein kinase n=1 Tax=Planobispora takensis TaxID=1367882 RepID=UPI001943BCB2|nr:serine/threonine-protein kinase [Planobispora takensis]